jgi:hypothetical protein
MSVGVNMPRGPWLAIVLMLSGCASTQILDLNGELTTLQQQKTTLEQQRNSSQDVKKDELTVKLAQVSTQFEQVADSAYAQAKQTGDVKAKISYYRIAATAEWQRGNERALTIAQEGTQTCDAQNGFEVAPRDCTILLTIPNLVVNDLWIAKLNKPGGINPAAPDFVSRGREAIVGLVQAYKGINVVLSRASGTGVSAETLQSLRGQQQRIKKSVQDLGNFILTRAKPADRPAALEICTVVRSEAPAILPSRCRS